MRGRPKTGKNVAKKLQGEAYMKANDVQLVKSCYWRLQLGQVFVFCG
jgi:hypothetical protein